MKNETENIWAKVQLKSAPEKFYGFFRNSMDDLVHMFPQKFKSFEFLEGDDFTSGSVMHWKYHLGSPAAVNVKMAAVDDENKMIIYEVVGGDILKHFQMFRSKIHVIEGALNYAHWTLEFQKVNEQVPSPENYLDLAVKVSKGLDAYLSKN